MKKKILCLFVAVLLLLFTFAGCNAGSAEDNAPYASYEASSFSLAASAKKNKFYSSDMISSSDVGTDLSSSDLPSDGSKLVRTAHATIKTETYEETLTKIKEKVAALGGRIDAESYDGYEPRDASLTVRIPVEKYNEFTGEFNDYGVVTYLSASIDDVTTAYAETLAEKETLEQAIDFYTELMKECKGIDEQSKVENELDSRKTKLEKINKTLATYDDKVAFSTIYLSIDEVKSEAAVKRDNIFKRIADTFTESLRGVGEGAADVIVFFFGNLPTIVIIGALIAGAFFLGRFLIRKKRGIKSGNTKSENESSEE